MSEDFAWVGGRIFTGTAYREALLVEGDRVVVAATRDEVLRKKATGTTVTNLRGRLIIPGLIDSHMHLPETTRAREGIDLRGASTLEEIHDRVERWATVHPTGPVIGRGWDQETLPDRRYPTQSDLDRMVSSRPLVLFRTCGHVAVVNTATLERVGWGRKNADPPGGRLGRTSNGDLNGLLFDSSLSGVAPLVRESATLDRAALTRTLRYATSLGLTTLASLNAEPEEVRALGEFDTARSLPVRLRFYLKMARMDTAVALRSMTRTDRVQLSGVKAITDGSFGARTAWLDSPYYDAPSEHGLPIGTTEELTQQVGEAVEAGFTPALHAIGDRALRRVLAIYSETPEGPGRRVEHASLTPATLLAEIDRVRPQLVVQPGFVTSDWWLTDRLGRERCQWAYAFRTLLERGHCLAGSSDAPVESLAPWLGLSAAVLRRDELGRSANPSAHERLAPEEALTLYTANGGRALGEPKLGTLVPEAPADFVVLRYPSVEVAIERGSSSVLETWSAGRTVFVSPA